MGTGDDRHHAARIEPYLHAFVEYPAELDVGRDGAAAQLAPPLALFAPRGKAVPVGEPEAYIHQLLELAAVVGVMGRRVIRQRFRLDQIAPAQLDPIDASDLRGALDQAFDQIDRLRPPSAAIDRGRRGIGEHGVGFDVDRLHVVEAGNEH